MIDAKIGKDLQYNLVSKNGKPKNEYIQNKSCSCNKI